MIAVRFPAVIFGGEELVLKLHCLGLGGKRVNEPLRKDKCVTRLVPAGSSY